MTDKHTPTPWGVVERYIEDTPYSTKKIGYYVISDFRKTMDNAKQVVEKARGK